MRWSSRLIRSTRSSALKCPSWRRNTLTICSRLLERFPPAGFSLLRSGSAAGTGAALCAEGRSAAAGRGRVRVFDGEAAAGHRVDKIDLGALEVAHADRVDEQLDAVRFEHLVAAAAGLFDHQAVLETR